MGRTVLDDRKKDQICAIVGVGCTRLVAAQFVGCHVSTILNTARRDAAFGERLASAEAAFEASQLKTIHTAASDVKNWRASAWLLERRFPNRWGKRSPDSLSVEQAMTLVSQMASILIDEVPATHRKKIIARLASLKIPVTDEHSTARITDAR